ncbi:hypothetical protein HY495_03175 [Candidatus Woesearchaeota archaeon]|nr:hypothetical protein [Candidatus Woesearchaeota archaeon]
MNKKEFAEKMLTFLTEFQSAPENDRKKLGKNIADFFKKNEQLDNGKVALNDHDLQVVGFAAELNDYRKETFSEDDLAVGISVLKKIVKNNGIRK